MAFGSSSHGKGCRETDMDNSFTIKPRPGVHKFSPRDPVPVRETVDTGLDTVRAATETSDGGDNQREPRQDHAPHDVVADPESREVINRENDVRAQSEAKPHPDQALLRWRAYRPAASESDSTTATEPHANIKA
jgi:hypothetical protein